MLIQVFSYIFLLTSRTWHLVSGLLLVLDPVQWSPWRGESAKSRARIYSPPQSLLHLPSHCFPAPMFQPFWFCFQQRQLYSRGSNDLLYSRGWVLHSGPRFCTVTSSYAWLPMVLHQQQVGNEQQTSKSEAAAKCLKTEQKLIPKPIASATSQTKTYQILYWRLKLSNFTKSFIISLNFIYILCQVLQNRKEKEIWGEVTWNKF